MKKIMIMGAGVYQYPLIKRAKEQGIYTIVVSIDGKYPGFKIADKIYYIDTRDKASVLDIAKNENIDGICTCGTDVAMETIGNICDALNLNGISEQSALAMTNKNLMKEKFKEFNIRTAGFKLFQFNENNEHEIINFCDSICYPVIFKILDSSGSRGIIIVNSKDEINNTINSIHRYTNENSFLIEKFIIGEEFGAQVFVAEGKIKVNMVHGDIVDTRETGVPVGHYYPYELTSKVYNDMLQQINNTIRAFNINEGALNFDFILSDNNVYVIEVGARAGGTMLPELVSDVYNINYYDLLLYSSINQLNKFDFDSINETNKAVIQYLLYSENEGILEEVIMPQSKYMVSYNLDYQKGDFIRKFANGTDRIGDYCIQSNKKSDLKVLINELSNIKDNIKIELK